MKEKNIKKRETDSLIKKGKTIRKNTKRKEAKILHTKNKENHFHSLGIQENVGPYFFI